MRSGRSRTGASPNSARARLRVGIPLRKTAKCDRRSGPITQPAQAPAGRHEARPDGGDLRAGNHVRAVHQDDPRDPGHFRPEQGRGDHGVHHGHIGRIPLQFLGHIAAELARRPAQQPVPDPEPQAKWIAGLPVLHQVGLRLPQIVVGSVLVPPECGTGRFEPGSQPFMPRTRTWWPRATARPTTA